MIEQVVIFNSQDYPSRNQVAYATTIAETLNKKDELSNCVTRWDYKKFIRNNVDEYHRSIEDPLKYEYGVVGRF